MTTTTRIGQVTLVGHVYHNVYAEYSTYRNGDTAISLIQGGELLTVATVCLVGCPPSPGCVWIKDWSENEGVLLSLIGAEVVTPTGRKAQAGFAVAHEAKLLAVVEAE